ncbi:hypothetical protein EJB05_48928, partial [Eragrostis curvula]
MVEDKEKQPRRGVLDLEAQFAFFQSRHRHPVTVAAHALLSWPLIFTNLLILHFLPLPSPLDPALALALAYAATYVAVDHRAGSLAALLFVGAWAASRALVEHLGFARLWRKEVPRVSEIPEVFLMEPFLVFLQILNKLFGYEPYPGFCKNVDRKMEADLKESRELKQKKIT